MRLDTYPLKEPVAGTGSSTPPLISCLLHSGILPTHHSLAVSVGGIPQQAQEEGGLVVFSWQCGAATPMEIQLMQEGRILRTWRGWWNGNTTLAHTGTLTLQVFCAGQPQPAGLRTPPSIPSPALLASASLNGSTALASPSSSVATTTAVLEWPVLAEAPQTLAPPPVQEVPTEDDLWSEAETRVAGSEGEEPDEEEFEEDEEGETPDEELEEEKAEEAPQEAEPASNAVAVSAPSTSAAIAPAGTVIAALHASQVWSPQEHERVVKSLETLLDSLPAKTILVDLRQHAPTPRTSRAVRARPHPMGLTKELLRTLYGARYWDRGAQFPTTRHIVPGRPPRWYRVVDQSAEGLETLVAALAQGFSLLLLDSVALYAESSRAAVLAELRKRVSVETGPCS